jgi:hypothetical protein
MATSDEVLDELTELAAVQHAVIAEYLQIGRVDADIGVGDAG